MFSLEQVREALGAELLDERKGSVQSFSAVVNDSRIAQPGQLFVALKTESRDGHDFLPDAISRGVAGVMVDREVEVPEGVAVFRVRDTVFALGELARWWRTQFLGLHVVAVAGNVGKTTTKELTAAVLGSRYNVLKSEANFNDNIGVAMSVLNLRDDHQVAVLEVGMDHPGEIARSCQIAGVDTSIVLNVGPTHLEKLGSMEAIAAAKAEAVQALSQHGTAVLNADDPYVAKMEQLTQARVLTFGIEKHATMRATDLKSHGLSGVDFTLNGPGRSLPTHSPLPGERLVANALAAMTVAFSLGFSLEEAAHALSVAQVPTRLQVKAAGSGATILDDSYNANPASMLAALSVLEEMLAARRLALLGDMLELGSAEAEGHQAVGEQAAKVVDALFTIGPRGVQIAAAARAAGNRFVRHFDSKEEAVEELSQLLQPGDVLLIKASHGVGLGSVVEALVA